MYFDEEEELDYGEDELENTTLENNLSQEVSHENLNNNDTNLLQEDTTKRDANINKDDTTLSGDDNHFLEIHFQEDENEVIKLLSSEDADAEPSAFKKKQDGAGFGQEKKEQFKNDKEYAKQKIDNGSFKKKFKRNKKSNVKSRRRTPMNKDDFNFCDRYVSLAESKLDYTNNISGALFFQNPPLKHQTEKRPLQNLQSPGNNTEDRQLVLHNYGTRQNYRKMQGQKFLLQLRELPLKSKYDLSRQQLLPKKFQSLSSVRSPSIFNKIFSRSGFQTMGNGKFYLGIRDKGVTTRNLLNGAMRGITFEQRNNLNCSINYHLTDFVPGSAKDNHQGILSNCNFLPNLSDAVASTNFKNSSNPFANATSRFNPKIREVYYERNNLKKGSRAFPGNKNFLSLNNKLTVLDKEKVKLKKEARLQRFTINPVADEEKSQPLQSATQANGNNLIFGDDYIKKIKEQQLRREEVLNLKEKQRTMRNSEKDLAFSPEKPSLNKESLMKKKNPFETNLKDCQIIFSGKVKKELDWRREETGKDFFKRLSSVLAEPSEQPIEKTCSALSSPLQIGNVEGEALKIVTGSTVKFVRTISKTYHELGLSKRKPQTSVEIAPVQGKCACLETEFEMREGSFLAKEESQVMECIVKVQNIPQETTTLDIFELCRPIGKALEIKLKFPRENSAVIRFANPTCAENFYGLYHGKKLKNCTLENFWEPDVKQVRTALEPSDRAKLKYYVEKQVGSV